MKKPYSLNFYSRLFVTQKFHVHLQKNKINYGNRFLQ